MTFAEVIIAAENQELRGCVWIPDGANQEESFWKSQTHRDQPDQDQGLIGADHRSHLRSVSVNRSSHCLSGLVFFVCISMTLRELHNKFSLLSGTDSGDGESGDGARSRPNRKKSWSATPVRSSRSKNRLFVEKLGNK
jgi:hypothetical protein